MTPPSPASPRPNAVQILFQRMFGACLGAFYAVLTIWTYYELSQLWDYLGFWYNPPSFFVTSLTVFASALLGLLLPSNNWSFVDFAKWLLYFILFIPALLIPVQQGVLTSRDLFLLEILIWCSAAGMMAVLRPGKPIPEIRITPRTLWGTVIAFWAIGNMAVIWVFGSSMSLAGLDQVYEQRSSAGTVASAAIVYLLGALSGAINPFLLVVGLARRSPLFLTLALVGQLIVYATLAGKVVIGATLLAAGAYFVFDRGRVVYWRVYAGVIAIAVMGPLTALPRSMPGSLVSTISDLVYMRILLLPGVLVGAYSEFFSRFPVTYLSHSLIGRPFSIYPYGDESVGQVIGRYVTPSANASVNNYNANFIAADGIAGFGTWGVPIVFLLTILWLWLVSKAVGGQHRAIVCASLTPFVVSLADASLFTAILTGGGGLITLLLFLYRSSEHTVAQQTPGFATPSSATAA